MTFRTRNRRLVITSSGLLGLAPAATQPGDCIIVIMNHGIPVVARPVGIMKRSEMHLPVITWRIVGECFVDGMMEGEMVREHIARGSREPDYLVIV